LRAELINPILAQHNGRVVKLMGARALVEFLGPDQSDTAAGASELVVDGNMKTSLANRKSEMGQQSPFSRPGVMSAFASVPEARMALIALP
jgi:hypothetical protein